MWFYWIFLGATVLDVFDGLLKGGAAYQGDMGFTIWLLWAVSLVACAVGLRSSRLVHHRITGAAVFTAQIVQSIDDLGTLGF